ncbi:DUF1465 family protein [uncultured Brevundimonas sp.]|uniref:protease adaptor protein RcdA n=1 Tax=uncultured Brevundimonas sp. TaxID=213418 RepID=UPI00343F5051
MNPIQDQSPDNTARSAEVLKFTASELFQRLFREGIELVEETASYLDGDGRTESRLLTRSAALSYASESMKLTTRLMQVSSWLLVQRAVNEGTITAEVASNDRYRLAPRPQQAEPLPGDLPIALVEYILRAERIYDRAYYLDQKMYVQVAEEPSANSVLSQMERLRAAFG